MLLFSLPFCELEEPIFIKKIIHLGLQVGNFPAIRQTPIAAQNCLSRVQQPL
jgi:hypothetical protein